jgi:uncharacterized protein involved in exopolysaccharide biosynthesis
MEFYRIWRILVGNKWLLICLPAFATLVGVALTYVLPEQFESTALVLVRPSEELKFNQNSVDQKEVLGFPVSQSAPIDATSKTDIEEIKSPAVATKIVEALQLYNKKPKVYDSAFAATEGRIKAWFADTMRTVRDYAKYGRVIPATPFEQAVQDVEDRLVASERKDTYAFDITYRSGNPQEAAAVANMAATIFLHHSAEVYSADAARVREFMEKQLDESRATLTQARAAILAYKNAGDTFQLSSEYSDKLKNLSDLQVTLAKDQGNLAGLKRTLIKDTPKVIAQEADIAELKQQIASLQQELTTYPAKETQINNLTLAERIAEENFEFLSKRYEEARVKEAAVVNQIRIVSPATPGLYPVKPVKVLYGGLSFAVGLIVAIGWALFFENLDPRIRTISILDDEIGVPVLGAIPTLKRSWWTVGT